MISLDTRITSLNARRPLRAAKVADRAPWDWYADSCSCGHAPGGCAVHPRGRPGQRPPAGDWRVWAYVAGRGAGKTRAGACWVQHRVESGTMNRGCLIAPTAADIRDVMVEGQSGLLAVAPPWCRPRFQTQTSNQGARNTMANPGSDDESLDKALERERPVKALLRLTETAAFLRSTDGRFYARVQVGARPEIYALGSAPFRSWLIDSYFRSFGQVVSDWSIRRALAKLEATARFERGTPSIFTRVGHEGDDFADGSPCYLDMADPIGRAIRIGSEGWSVIDNPPVHFRRRHGHLPLPMPIRGGSIELLRRYVNVSDEDFRLLVVWMAAALRPVGPYPILVLNAGYGAAKTTTANVLRMVIDPRAARMPGQPRNTRALMVAAANRWVLCRAWPTSPYSPRPLAERSAGPPIRFSQTTTTIAGTRP